MNNNSYLVEVVSLDTLQLSISDDNSARFCRILFMVSAQLWDDCCESTRSYILHFTSYPEFPLMRISHQYSIYINLSLLFPVVSNSLEKLKLLLA